MNNSSESLHVLFQHGAQPTQANSSALLPLHVAASQEVRPNRKPQTANPILHPKLHCSHPNASSSSSVASRTSKS